MPILDTSERARLGTIDVQATAATRQRYDRLAPIYDRMERGMERRFTPLRAALWQAVRGPTVLEIGVGTGANMPFYPPGVDIMAVDLSPQMLAQARARAAQLNVAVTLREADAQALPFPDASFDTVVTTCVFCSVPDPQLGLAEVVRVLKPSGQLLMLEHVRSHHVVLGTLMDLLNPLVVRVMGANINRETVRTIERAGLVNVQAQDRMLDILKLIEASAPRSA
jgi:ubiquinone/menaquinone biosynthesis C-methylase UbiE